MGVNVLNILTKATGAVGAGLILYDAHHAGKIHASAYEKNHKSGQLSELYLDDLRLDSPSVVKAKAKSHIFKFFLDENASGFFTNIIGYVKGFGSMLESNILPLGLALGTFIGSKGIRGGISKFCGVGLLAYGGIFLAQEIFGIGKSR